MVARFPCLLIFGIPGYLSPLKFLISLNPFLWNELVQKKKKTKKKKKKIS